MKVLSAKVVSVALALVVAGSYANLSKAQETDAAVVQAKPRRYIVTDVDDTIKLTDVAHLADAVIRAAFSRKTFAGISTLYRELSAQNDEAVLYFVSGGPQFLRNRVVNMIESNRFPQPWTLSLRDQLSVPTQKFKIATISKIIEQLPSDSQVILVGDDGEQDPETYAAILAKFPNRVDSIYIHRIRGRALPAGEAAYDTPMDIALIEMEKGNLSPEQAVHIGNVVLAEGQIDEERLVLPFNFCPMSFEAPNQQTPKAEERDAYELSTRIHERIQEICLERMKDRMPRNTDAM